MKNSNFGVLFLHRLTLKLQTKATKTKQCSKQTCLQNIVLLNNKTMFTFIETTRVILV